MKILRFCILISLFHQLSAVAQDADSIFVADSIDRPLTVSPEFLVNQAKQYEEKPKVAILLYQEALDAKTEAISPNWEGDVRVALARMYFQAASPKLAFEQLLNAQSIYSQTANLQGQLDVMAETASYYERIKDFKEAERYLHLVMKLQEEAGLSSAIPELNYRLANLYFRKKDFDKAETALVAASNEFELNNNREKAADCYMLLADINRSRQNLKEAERLVLKRALPTYSAVDNKKGRVNCFNLLGSMYYDQRRFSEAKWFYIQSNTQCRLVQDTEGTIYSLLNLAKIKSAIGDNKSSLKDFKEAEALARKTKNTALIAKSKAYFVKYYNKPIKAAVPKLANAPDSAKRQIKKGALKTPAIERAPVLED